MTSLQNVFKSVIESSIAKFKAIWPDISTAEIREVLLLLAEEFKEAHEQRLFERRLRS